MCLNEVYDLFRKEALVVLSDGRIVLNGLYTFVSRHLIWAYHAFCSDIESIKSLTFTEIVYLVSFYVQPLAFVIIKIFPADHPKSPPAYWYKLGRICRVSLFAIQTSASFIYIYACIMRLTIFYRIVLFWWYSFLVSAFVVYVVALGFEDWIGYQQILKRRGLKTLATQEGPETVPAIRVEGRTRGRSLSSRSGWRRWKKSNTRP